jgi:putative DNA primase/helicase
MDPPPTLLIVDPIVSAVAGDSHKSAEVRRALQPLVDLAAAVRCAVLGISHFTKGTAGRDPVERVTGSLAFGALPRVVLAAAKRREEDGGGRMLARAKNNIGVDSGGFGYDVEPLELPGHPGVHTTHVVWGERLEGTARELLERAETSAAPDERSAQDDAEEWLSYTLSFGPVDGKELKKLARAEGIAERTLYRAADALRVGRQSQGFGKARRWFMCAKSSESANESCSADIGTDGTHEPVSAMPANARQTKNPGTHGDLGTHGGCAAVMEDPGPCPPERQPFVEDF